MPAPIFPTTNGSWSTNSFSSSASRPACATGLPLRRHAERFAGTNRQRFGGDRMQRAQHHGDVRIVLTSGPHHGADGAATHVEAFHDEPLEPTWNRQPRHDGRRRLCGGEITDVLCSNEPVLDLRSE